MLILRTVTRSRRRRITIATANAANTALAACQYAAAPLMLPALPSSVTPDGIAPRCIADLTTEQWICDE